MKKSVSWWCSIAVLHPAQISLMPQWGKAASLARETTVDLDIPWKNENFAPLTCTTDECKIGPMGFVQKDRSTWSIFIIFSVKPKRKQICGMTSGGEGKDSVHFMTGASGLCEKYNLNLEKCRHLVRLLDWSISFLEHRHIFPLWISPFLHSLTSLRSYPADVYHEGDGCPSACTTDSADRGTFKHSNLSCWEHDSKSSKLHFEWTKRERDYTPTNRKVCVHVAVMVFSSFSL